MRKSSHDHWEQIKEEIILLCVQWYLTERLSYSQLKMIMQQRGFKVDPRMINNLVSDYSPLAMKRFKETERKRKQGWRVAQIPFKMRGKKKYLYRALDAQGNTLDFMIMTRSNKDLAKKFFEKTISKNTHHVPNKIISRREKLSLQYQNILKNFIVIIILSSLGMFLFNQVATYHDRNKIQNNSSFSPNTFYYF